MRGKERSTEKQLDAGWKRRGPASSYAPAGTAGGRGRGRRRPGTLAASVLSFFRSGQSGRSIRCGAKVLASFVSLRWHSS